MVEIEITCTDRLGHRLETRIVSGASFNSTLEDRVKAFKELKALHMESDGSEPFIFTDTRSR